MLKICVIGGSGFVGTHMVNTLAGQDHQIKVISRRPERCRHLTTVPGIRVESTDFFASKILERQLDTYDVVINLVGILNPIGSNTFEQVHVDIAGRIAEAAQAVGTPRLLHMSALNADENAASSYLRTKGKAQNLVHGIEKVDVTSFSPSVIFGSGDSFYNRFASLLKQIPGVFPLTCAKAKFAPIYVGDVVDAFVNSIDNKATFGKNYALCGPNTYTLKEIVNYTAKKVNSKSMVLPLNNFFSKPIVWVADKLPAAPISMDNYYSMLKDSVCEQPIAEELGVSLHSVESIVPQYLAGHDFAGKMELFREYSKR
jgi:NADH dehydrogenase